MNFILALVCLVGAIVLFAYQMATEDRRFHIRGTDLSVGWLLLVMAAYNLVRWWSVRNWQIQQAEIQAQAARVRKRYSERREERVPDPNFDFTDAPAPRPSAPDNISTDPPPPNGEGRIERES
jgi:hypothetical protein